MRSHSWPAMATLAFGLLGAAAGAGAERCDNPRATQEALRASFQCTSDLRQAQAPPVLLVPGTALDPEVNFGWNYVPALTNLGRPVCSVALPDNALADIQLSAEHIEFAIRQAYRLSGRKVQVIGFSQGGMAPRWTLRFSPDTRTKVADMISLSGSHHGSLTADPFCTGALAGPGANGVVGCEPAIWQQRVESAFIETLNEDFETVPGVDYTAIFTEFDDVLISNQPSVGGAPTSELRDGGDNVVSIALQDVCPLNMADHRAIGTFDPVGFAIALDALEHDGPASLERILDGAEPGASPLCANVFMPGVDPDAFASNLAAYDQTVATSLFVTGEHAEEEPPLACYTRGNGRESGASRQRGAR